MVYKYEFIKAIDDWQQGAGDFNVIAKRIIKYSPNISLIKKSPLLLYRIAWWSPDHKEYKESIRSFTSDLEICKSFLKEFWFGDSRPDTEKSFPVIFKIIPNQSRVICNLIELHNDPIFIKDIKYWEEKKGYFDSGLEFGDSQKEVIYKQHNLTDKDIFLIWSIPKQKWLKHKIK